MALNPLETSASDIVSSLATRLYTTDTFKESYKFALYSIFKPELVFDGNYSAKYTFLKADVNTEDIGDHTSLETFKANVNKAYEEVVKADKTFNFKTATFENAYFDFLTNPGDQTIAAFFTSVEAIFKDIAMAYEKMLWEKVDSTAVVKVGTSDSIKNAKLIYNTLLDYTITSDIHEGVGADIAKPGVITLKNKETGADETIQPLRYFDTSDFYVATSTRYETAIEFDGNRTLFNWNGNKLPIAGHIRINPKIDAVIRSATLTNIDADKTEAILIHKNSLKMLLKWSKMENELPRNGKIVYRSFNKAGLYKYLDKPIVIINNA